MSYATPLCNFQLLISIQKFTKWVLLAIYNVLRETKNFIGVLVNSFRTGHLQKYALFKIKKANFRTFWRRFDEVETPPNRPIWSSFA